MRCACGRDQAAKTTSSGAERLPPGWHREGEAITCRPCWARRFVLRAVTVPVASVERRGDEPLGREGWATFRPVLRAAQLACLRIANDAVARLAVADLPVLATARAAGETKLPPPGRLYLYPTARALAPDLGTSTVVAILHAVERRYRARRFHALWLSREALPTYRDPAPVPLTAQVVAVAAAEDGCLRLSLPLGGVRWTLRLAGGAGHRRALGLLREVAAGRLAHGEATLLEVPAQRSDHRATGPECGATRRRTRLVAKVCVWRPREAARGLEPARTLRVTTGPGALLAHEVEGDVEPQLLHEDAARRWVAAHARQLQRESDDMRASPPERREALLRARGARLRLHRDRMRSHVQRIAALVRDAAVRRRCGTIDHDDRDRGYVLTYPWYALRQRLGQLCDEAGIALHVWCEHCGQRLPAAALVKHAKTCRGQPAASAATAPDGPAPLADAEQESTP